MSTDSKPCRNCGNSEFFTKEVSADGAAMLPIGALHGPKYQIVVCGSCGLTEWFVPSRFLPLVREKLDPL
ncbi:zinc ribbon domain-containing protein [Pseudoduganella namucuonensis]|uniref:Nucleic-acid-binding protein containing Zn-ribbon domain n=1 Tax=Pseudoduganella namucuonensis TaxID=1035707 RepID=A0A1I7KSB3_9BURK|nr:zinc ribbon domain-containing protein [Pseudoduganella namucuonensis]SFV00331.1 Nucleic-acid-binding protein containing Zn-ribbon domain [Pseudoduganella namucuonensis]